MTFSLPRALLLALPLLSACGGGEPPPPPPPPTLVSVALRATPDVNPDASGMPKPIRVRLFRLENGRSFAESDFFSIDGDPKKALGGDLKGAESFVLAPGTERVWQAKLEPGENVIGVMGAYFQIDQSEWRAWKAVPPMATTLLVAEFGPGGVTLREAGL